MAQVSTVKATMILFAIVMFAAAATVSAQEVSPTPSPDVGSAFSVPLPNAMIVSSLLVSLIALIKH